MNRAFRKYHRVLAIIICLPLLITVVTGVLVTLIEGWLQNPDLAYQILKVHTMEIIGLQNFYPLLNGIAVLGLIVTGVTMTGLFRRRPASR